MPRDKLAAMASRAAESSAGDTNNQSTATSSSSLSASASAQAPRRDKLAALAASNNSNTGRGSNKFAAMAAASSASSAGPLTGENQQQDNEETERMKREEHLSRLKERMTRRRKIFENLDRAEDLTCKLLEIVHKTTTALQDLSSSSSRELNQLSRVYRLTLQEIHPLLSQDTEQLVQPYQNHSTETKQSMYAARVEMRLARERTDVLKSFTELEKKQTAARPESESLVNKKKRPRSQD